MMEQVSNTKHVEPSGMGYQKRTRLRCGVTATLPHRVSKSAGAEGDFSHFLQVSGNWSSILMAQIDPRGITSY